MYNYIKLIIIFIIIIFICTKTFNYLDKLLETSIQNKTDKNSLTLELSQKDLESKAKIQEHELNKMILKSCYDNREFIDFINCVSEVKKLHNN
ncbi:hypothetical protein J5751_04945 [bacterium]|nr:hypothetical protein [bacterium]